MVFLVLEKMIEIGDDTDTDNIIVLGNIPEPALLLASLQDQRCSFIFSGIAIGTLEVAPDGAVY
jgi:hypothetical protein